MTKVAVRIVDAQIILASLYAAVLVVGIPFGIQPYAVVSASMEPSFPVGSIAYVDTNAQAEQLCVGDAIAFHSGSSEAVVTHRIVQVDSETCQFVTKGDANSSEDPFPVAYSQVIGKAIGAIPFLGSIASCDRQSLFVAIAALALFDLVIYAAAWVIDERRKQKKGARHDNIYHRI